MAAPIHILSSSDSDSEDSVPDLRTRLKSLVSQPFLSVGKESNCDEEKKIVEDDDLFVLSDKINKQRFPKVPDDFDDELPEIHDFTLLEDTSRGIADSHQEKVENTATGYSKRKLLQENAREEKEAKRKCREEEKLRRAVEKAEAKARKETEKAYKQAMKPGECMKYVVVHLDRQLLELAEGSQIISQLQSAEIRYRVIDSPVPLTMTIMRVDPVTLQETPADEAVIVMAVSEFVDLIKQQMYEDGVEGLCRRCCLWKRKLNIAKLTLVVCGIDMYLRNRKTSKQQNFRSAVLGETSRPVRGRKKKSVNEFHGTAEASVSRVDIETALVSAQLQCSLNHRLLEDANKVAMFILQVTKAVAEAPFKHEKGKPSFSWYAEGSSTNTVKVDKSGVGLLKLWHQQLRQFNNVGVEVAQAIAREYPSPQALIQSYRKCQTFRDASLLLADIPVRRGAGPLVSTRRVGPDLSKKIHLFFTTADPEVSLGQTL